MCLVRSGLVRSGAVQKSKMVGFYAGPDMTDTGIKKKVGTKTGPVVLRFGRFSVGPVGPVGWVDFLSPSDLDTPTID